MFLAEVTPTRLVPLECILAHQVRKLKKVSQAATMFEGLVQFLPAPRDPDLSPECIAEFGDAANGIAKLLSISGDPALVDHQFP